MNLDDNFKKLINQLGTAINDSLADSKDIANVLEEIRNSGYDLFLVLEVTIGFNRRSEEKTGSRSQAGTGKASESDFHLSSDDTKFLRSLKIRVEENPK